MKKTQKKPNEEYVKLDKQKMGLLHPSFEFLKNHDIIITGVYNRQHKFFYVEYSTINTEPKGIISIFIENIAKDLREFIEEHNL